MTSSFMFIIYMLKVLLVITFVLLAILVAVFQLRWLAPVRAIGVRGRFALVILMFMYYLVQCRVDGVRALHVGHALHRLRRPR